LDNNISDVKKFLTEKGFDDEARLMDEISLQEKKLSEMKFKIKSLPPKDQIQEEKEIPAMENKVSKLYNQIKYIFQNKIRSEPMSFSHINDQYKRIHELKTTINEDDSKRNRLKVTESDISEATKILKSTLEEYIKLFSIQDPILQELNEFKKDVKANQVKIMEYVMQEYRNDKDLARMHNVNTKK